MFEGGKGGGGGTLTFYINICTRASVSRRHRPASAVILTEEGKGGSRAIVINVQSQLVPNDHDK